MSSEKDIVESKVKIVKAPDGHEGSGFFATSLDQVVGLARK